MIFDVENLGQASTGKNSGTAPRSAVGVGADPTQWGHRSQSDESFTNADKQFGRFDTRDEYEAQMLPERIRLIHDVLSKNDRKLIVCYGKASRRVFERIFEDAKWRDAGKDRVADFNGARIVLTDHFSTRRFSIKGMQELAEAALAPPAGACPAETSASPAWNVRSTRSAIASFRSTTVSRPSVTASACFIGPSGFF
ncbi:MAG TPA: hypothetical protein VGG22_08545 [Candidatus Baltobacteraceae bacterium]